MAGDLVSAGSFIAAVLEQAGYLTQGRFLEEFRSFFRDAGALVYFIGAVGGLLSIVIFGSFRAARYLIFGPAIYWFLVGPVTDIQGVVAKLGGGEARGLPGDIGEGNAISDRDKVLEKAGFENRSIKVATGFWLFAKPINDFVQEFVDIMLKSEDGEDLMVAHKVRGLEVIARSMPENPEIIHVLEEEVLTNCSQSFAAAMGVAESYIKERATQGISPATRQTNVEKYRQIRAENYAKYNNLAANEKIEMQKAPKLSEHIKVQANNSGSSKYAAGLYKDGNVVDVITCGDAWNLFLEILWHESAKSIPNILRLTSGEWQSAEAQQKACELLTSKIYDDGPALGQNAGVGCDIRPGVALALLSNHLSYADTFGRVLKRHMSNNDPLNPTSHSAIIAAESLSAFSKENKKALGLAVNTITGLGGSVGLMANVAIQAAGGVDKVVASMEWAPTAALNLIHGLTHSEQIGVPIYAMTLARKSLFSKAMDLPYYQGVCLYYIAVFYPFAALLVLIPGKAVSFINVPLFWLWVKSWDIGFAALILLEKVMFNLLPNWSVARQLRTGPWDYQLLPIVLGEGFNFSHVQSVAQYYTVLAMATMAVPAIMAVIVLKGKKAVLSSFTDAVERRSTDSAQREAGAYSMGASNERAAILANIKGLGKQLVVQGDGGVEGGLRGRIGMGYASAAAASKSPAAFMSGDRNKMLSNVLSSGKESLEQLFNTYGTIVSKETKFESEQRAAFDPLVGRWGAIAQYADAYAAALDGAGARLGGGFETNDAKANGVDQYIDLATEKFKVALGIEKNISDIQGAAVSRIIKGENKGTPNFIADSAIAGTLAPDIIKQLEDNKLIPEGSTANLKSILPGSSENQNSMPSADTLINLMGTNAGFKGSGYSEEASWNRYNGTFSTKENAAESSIESFGGSRQIITGTREEVDARLKNTDSLPPAVGVDSYLSNVLGSFNNISLSQETDDLIKNNQRIIDTERKNKNLEEYNKKLSENLNYFSSASGINFGSESSEGKIIEMLKKAKDVESEISVSGKTLGYKLPKNLESHIDSNPVWVTESLNEWFRNATTAVRDKAVIESNIKSGAPIINSPSQIRGGR